MDRTEELRDLMIKHFGSVAAFARAADLPATTIYNVLSRGIEGTSFETVFKIYETLQIDWRATGLDGPFKSKLDDDHKINAVRPDFSYHVIPMLGNVAAGEWREVYEQQGETVSIPGEFQESHPRAFGVKPTGGSMDKLFSSDEIAICDPDLEVRDGDIGLVAVNGDEATIKRVYYAGNMLILHAETTMEDDYPDRAIDLKDPTSPPVYPMARVFWKTLPAREIKF